MFELVDHSRCESIYKDDETGEKIRLWAIVGGQLAVAFNDFEFTKHLNYCEQFDSTQDSKWRAWTGPRLKHVDGGEDRIQEWLEKAMPLRALRRERYARVMEIVKPTLSLGNKLRSRRLHDRENHVYYWVELEFNSRFLKPVTCTARRLCESSIAEVAGAKWKTLMSFFNPLHYNGLPKWEELSEEVFEQALEVLRQVS